MKKLSHMLLALVSIVLVSAAPQIASSQTCGKERWSVKTGADSGASQVGLNTPQAETISDLVTLPPPSASPGDTRFAPTENTVYIVHATLTDYKLEVTDSDYHLVVMDDAGNTMIAEIPSPFCVDGSSPFLTQISNARSQFDAQLQTTPSFQTANVPVQVTGVGFFDRFHNQHGVAPNVIELHPVLDIQFNPASAAGDFAISTSTSAMHLHANSSSSAVITMTPLKGTVPSNVVFAVSGVPQGVTSQITPTADGKAKLVLSASSSAVTGTFPVTVSGTTKGRIRSSTINLHVSGTPATTEAELWENKMISAKTEEEVLTQSNKLGADGWELISVVRVSGSPAWRAFLRRSTNH
jgi:hypothetical protein